MIEWINVDDGHPDLEQEVLVCSENFVYYAVFNGKYKQQGIDCLYLKGVTHWMSLPEPPTK